MNCKTTCKRRDISSLNQTKKYSSITTSSIAVCPINFKEFDAINSQLRNLEASLLYSKLKFHAKNSVIKKNGKSCLFRSREQIAVWLGFGIKKVDRLLLFLEKEKLIEKKPCLWYGKKRLCITLNHDSKQIPINLSILKILTHHIGSVKSALVFSKIAYAFANTKINRNGLMWCCIKKELLATWSGLSIRTIDKIIQGLLKKGFILKKNFVWKEKNQTHYHIPAFIIESLKEMVKKENIKINRINSNNKTEETKQPRKKEEGRGENHQNSVTQICRKQSADLTLSIIKGTNYKKETINNTTSTIGLSTTRTNNQSDIIFTKIGNELTRRQTRYLEGALNNTLNRKKINVSCPEELREQFKFSILNNQQRAGVYTFQHAVSRCMKILADGNWRTPIGFYNHSAYGVTIKEQRRKQEEEWRVQKGREQLTAKEAFIKIQELTPLHQLQDFNQEELTNKATESAKLLVRLSKDKGKINNKNTVDMMERLTKEIAGFIRQGANKEAILNQLRWVGGDF